MANIKEKIRQLSPPAERKYIRLIHNGRILDDTRSLHTYGIGKPMQTEAKSLLPLPSPVYLHCSLSDYIPKAPVMKTPQTTQLTGFDRLRESGLTEDDIRNIRAQFHFLHSTTDTTVEARNLEERWIDNAGDTLPDESKL
ncbi:hypothetical protein DFQ29_001092 [Apophysomyces sp. BC1021]|nr:hypothetical protein DFQ29_001092 [Apophysomyces sp. BC1021]